MLKYWRTEPGAQNKLIAEWLERNGFEPILDPAQVLGIDMICGDMCSVHYLSFHCMALTCRDAKSNRYIWRRKDDTTNSEG